MLISPGPVLQWFKRMLYQEHIQSVFEPVGIASLTKCPIQIMSIKTMLKAQ